MDTNKWKSVAVDIETYKIIVAMWIQNLKLLQGRQVSQ